MVVRCLALCCAAVSFLQLSRMDLLRSAATFFNCFSSLKWSSLSYLSFAVSTLPCRACTASVGGPSLAAAHCVDVKSGSMAGSHKGNVSDVSISRKDMVHENKLKIKRKPCNSGVKRSESAASLWRPTTQTMASTEQTQREGNAGGNIEGKQQIYMHGGQRDC
jgi:hypothetical protein